MNEYFHWMNNFRFFWMNKFVEWIICENFWMNKFFEWIFASHYWMNYWMNKKSALFTRKMNKVWKKLCKMRWMQKNKRKIILYHQILYTKAYLSLNQTEKYLIVKKWRCQGILLDHFDNCISYHLSKYLIKDCVYKKKELFKYNE